MALWYVPCVVRQTEIGAGGLTSVTAIAAPGGEGVLTVDVNLLLYSYGIALYSGTRTGSTVLVKVLLH